MRVRIGGVELKGEASYGESGFIIKPGGWKGWDSGPGTRGQRIEIPQGDGDFDLPVFRSSRLIQASGHCFADSVEELTHAGDTFTGLLAEGPDKMLVEQGSDTRWATVRLGDDPLFVPWGGALYAEFTLQVWAPDPLKFGSIPGRFLGGSPASHRGNVSAAPVHVIDGNHPDGYTINGPDGKSYVVTTPVVPGIQHRVDMRTGYLYVGGVLTLGGVSRPETWGIPRGREVVHTLSSSGSGYLLTLVFDTFI